MAEDITARLRKGLQRASPGFHITGSAYHHTMLDEAANEIERLRRDVRETREAQKHTFELYAAARDGIYNFQCADTDSQFLRDAAEKIDCGTDCRYSSYDASCNAHECSRMEKPEGCDAWLATQLIELAAAFDAKRAARDNLQKEDAQ